MDEHPEDPLHIATYAVYQSRAREEDVDINLDRVWVGVAAEVWARRVGPVERLAGHLVGSPGLARALVTTPSLVLSWLVASVVVLAAGVVATRTTGAPWVALLAPALAGAGIAYAYGPSVDPAFELGRTMAVPDRMVLLVRALAVFGLDALLGVVASLASADAAGLTLGWLAPMTAVAALALAAATLARSANVGVVAALAAWGIVVLAGMAGTRDIATAVAGATLTPAYLTCALACAGVTVYATDGKRNEGVWR